VIQPDDIPYPESHQSAGKITPKQIKLLYALSRNIGWTGDMLKEYITDNYGCKIGDVTTAEFKEVLAHIEGGEKEELPKAKYESIERAVKKLVSGYGFLAMIKGKGGIGKSHTIRKTLIETKEEFVEINGDVTSAYLYRLLFENNGKVIWFKDVPNILSKSMNLLKAAAETEKVRLITKSNYSTYQQDLPNSFIYTGRMIFDYNELSGISKAAKMDFEALKTRAEYVELNVSNEEIIEVMRKIAKLDWQKEVTEFIVENHLKYGLESVNLRTQTKAFNTFLYSKEKGLDWKVELVRELEIEVSPIRKLLFSLIGNKAVKTSELKKILLKKQIFNSLTSANRRVNEYIEIGELKRWTGGERDFYVSINERQIIYNTE